MISKGSNDMVQDLSIVRLARGMLLISLGLIYYGLVQSYYAHQLFINDGIPALDPLFAGLVGPLMFSSFVTGIFEMIQGLRRRMGIQNGSIIDQLVLVFALGLEALMIIIIWLLGTLSVQGYGVFVFMAVSQFVLFSVLIFGEVYLVFRN